MKKLLIISLLALCALTINAQTPIQENSLAGYMMFSGWSGDKFASTNGGIKIGTIVSIDKERKLFLRTGFSSLQFQGEAIQSIDILPSMTWFIGNKWSMYALGGLTGYVSGENSGIDAMGGFGMSRRFWTAKIGVVPASLDVFGELLLSQSRDQVTGGMAQVNIGVKFGRSE